jgi:hypothetical protein
MVLICCQFLEGDLALKDRLPMSPCLCHECATWKALLDQGHEKFAFFFPVGVDRVDFYQNDLPRPHFALGRRLALSPLSSLEQLPFKSLYCHKYFTISLR